MSDQHHADHDHGNCHELLGSLSDYVDGELEEALCQEIEAHMAGCENCRVVVNTLAKTVELYQEDLPADELPKDVESRLYKKLNLSSFLEETVPQNE